MKKRNKLALALFAGIAATEALREGHDEYAAAIAMQMPSFTYGSAGYARKDNLTKKQKKARAKNKRAKQSRRKNR